MELTIGNICFDDCAAICCRFIKKSLYKRLGFFVPFDESGSYVFSNDKEFLLRAALSQTKNVYVHYIGHNYLAHKGSSTFGSHRQTTIRMCTEHMQIAEKFLQEKTLTRMQRWQLIYWYNDQAARLFAYSILDGKFREAGNIVTKTMRKYHIIWPISFVLTSVRIALKKTFS